MNESSVVKESKQSKKRSKRSQKAIDKVSKKKKKRKTKDPDAPKRPLGPYFFYFRENNARVKQENPELIQKEVVARIAANWKTLTEEQKVPYVQQSNQDKQRYNREIEEYKERKRKEEEKDRQEESKGSRKRRPSKDLPYPKSKHKRTDDKFDCKNEKVMRLKDLIGADQVSFNSESDDLAAWSPPTTPGERIRKRENNPETQIRSSAIEQNNKNGGVKEEHEEKHRNDGKLDNNLLILFQNIQIEKSVKFAINPFYDYFNEFLKVRIS